MAIIRDITLPNNQNYDIYGKNLQNVTWQEYEAIEDKNDDKAYFITDVPPSEQKKTAVKPLPTGSISTVTDAAPLPLNALKVSVEAVQDLHGYDHPWVWGAGKNKLPLTVDTVKSDNTSGTWNGNAYTINGAKYTINTDMAGNIINVFAESVQQNPNGSLLLNLTLPAGDYILSSGFNEINGANDSYLQKNGVTIARGNAQSPGYAFKLPETSALKWYLRLSRSSSSFMAYPMIRLATVSDATFTPYSNICPINGWDSGEITVCEKNLFDKDKPLSTTQYTAISDALNEYINDGKYAKGYITSGTTFSVNSEYMSAFIEVKEGITYSFQTSLTSVLFLDGEGNIISRSGSWISNYTHTVGVGERYAMVGFAIRDLSAIQIEKGTTPTTYEPYQGKQYTQQFPQTIYGAEWDVTDGGMNATWEIRKIKDLTWLYNNAYSRFYTNIANLVVKGDVFDEGVICECYQTADTPIIEPTNTTKAIAIYSPNANTRALYVKDTDYTNISDFVSAMGEYQVCYELATPVPINLSPLSIRMNEGTNNLYVDCGDIIDGEYFGNNTNQIRVNDEIIAGGNSVTFAAESKYAEHAEVAEVANNIQNIDYDDYDAIVDKDNDIAYIVNDVPSSESGSNYFKDLPSGSVSTVTDATALPLSPLKVSVDAVQDLHGYDKPWVGGAGKNKLVTLLDRIKNANSEATWNGNVATLNGLTFAVKSDNDDNTTGIIVNGTATANTVFAITRTPEDDMTLPLGSFTLSGCPSGGGNNTYYVGINHGSNYSDRVTYGYDTGSGMTFNSVSDTDYIGCWIYVVNGANISNKEFNIMVRVSSQSATFEPYSNISSISGWNEGSVGGTGKNWWNGKYVSAGFVESDTWEEYAGGAQAGFAGNNAMPIFVGKQYICSYDGVAEEIRYIFLDADKNTIGNFANGTTTASAPSNAKYLRWRQFHSPTTEPTKTQIEIGTQATSFEPYQTETTTLNFPQTIYGAEWDVTNGGMNNQYGFEVFDGSDDEGWQLSSSAGVRVDTGILRGIIKGALGLTVANIMCNSFVASSSPSTYAGNIGISVDGGGYLGVADGSRSMTVEGWKSWLAEHPLQVKYELATPTTIQLSPLSIQLLEGTNNIYADCGDIINGEYCTNTSNQLCINDKVVSGDRMVPQSLVSKYSDYSIHADKANDSTHADIADNACTFSVDENGLLTISLVSGDSNNLTASTRSIKSTTTLPLEEEITNEKSEEEEVKNESVEEEPVEEESEIVEEQTDETEEEPSENESEEPSVEEEKDNDDGGEETPPEQNMR